MINDKNRQAVGTRLRKRMLVLPAATALLLGSAAAPLAVQTADAAAGGPKLQLKTMQINADGRTLSVPAGTTGGETFVALSFLGKQLGLTTAWNAKTRIISVNGKNKTMEMKAGSEDFAINGHHLYGTAPIVLDGTTYLPLRFLLEQMGYAISYDAAAKSISIAKLAENDIKLTNKTLTQKSGSLTISVQYPQLQGPAGGEGALEKINAFLESEAEKYIKDGSGVLEEARDAEAAGDAGREEAAKYDYDVDYTITANTCKKLSLYFTMYEYTGGAHGMYDCQAHTFDLADGKELSLQEAALNNPDYIDIINAEIKKQIAANKEMFLIEPFVTIKPDQRFFLRGSSLVVYFSLYEYTPYAEGIPEFSIPLSKFAK